MSHMPPRDMDLREWSEAIGVPVWTVRGWTDMDDFPTPSRVVGRIRFYLERDLNAFRKRHPTLGLGRGGWKKKAGE